MRLLLVEDDPMIGESIVEGLRSESYAVDWVRDGRDAELALKTVDYDLMLLDLGLPGKQGMEVLLTARKRGADLPVLIITARDGTPARVAGLDAGADDYLVKPFDLDELLARIRALLRRRVNRTRSVIEHGALTLDLASHEVTFEGAPVKLSAREFSVLRALLDNPGSVVSKSQLEEKLYGWNSEVESNTVDVYVHHLRKKFGTDFIKNVRGVGYKIPVAQ
ncbi:MULTISPECIES: response regulator transcription factor [unclassified Duganella]|uniref:response regulator n=1 Tax=unclassified Duganella TaxID=2636909 RepID=UPI000883BD48|nr:MULTISPECIES: response regulator transcription factor [unclassified Duganella]SDG78334.1 two-component system, OmpR family, response regulator [Duganella sp. OV458]SDK05307.1 two component transcriptional regulator, winged helix family [Duganella sp. OV510]